MLPNGNGGWISVCERDKLANDPRLTRYHELVLTCAPIVFEKSLKVDNWGRLVGLRPKMAPFHLDLYVHFGCRGYTSTRT